MGVLRHFIVPFACVLLLAFTSCGGTGALLDDNSSGDPAAVAEALSALESTGVADPGEEESTADGLPGIPLETDAEPGREASEIGNTVVLGKDFIQQFNSTVDGDSLVIGGDDIRLAYGMYKFGGLLGQRPISLNVECVPEALNQPYFVGVADYTAGKWHWFGPLNLPESELDLARVQHQLVSHLGNMYFIVVTHEGNSATHFKSTLVTGTPDGGGLPGCPHHLVASDGRVPNAVRLEWIGGLEAGEYQVWRKPVFGGGQWQPIGHTPETNYLDAPLPDWKMFFYRVRSVNPNGESCWSNIDTGFAGGGREPGVIRGFINMPNGEAVAGVPVHLLGAGEELLRRTDAEGRFMFRDLPPGRYLVSPHHPEFVFLPRYVVVDLTDRLLAEVSFQALREAALQRAWGFVFTTAPPPGGDPVAGGGVIPLPGVHVVLRSVADPSRKLVVQTNQDGFYLFENIPQGVWMLSPVAPDFNFIPGPQEIIVNGMNRPGRHDFVGLPKPPLNGGEEQQDGGGDGGTP